MTKYYGIKKYEPGGISKSALNVEWHIDPINGDDNGIGSAIDPFKSFRCLEKLPQIIEDHDIIIKPKAGTYTYFPKLFRPYTSGGGRIIIDASSQTFPKYAGPFTITSVTPVGNVAHFGVAHATDLTVTGAGWTVDEFYGYHIRMLTGNWAGYILYLHNNTSDTITTIADWYGFAPGDTFEIVSEPVKIEVNHPIRIRGNSTIHEYTFLTTPDTPFEPSLLMCGIRIDSSSYNPFVIEEVNAFLSASTLWGSNNDNNSRVVHSRDLSINYDDIPSGTFDGGATFEDFYALSFNIIPHDGDPLLNGGNIPTCFQGRGHIYISQTSFRGELRLVGSHGDSATFGLQIGKCTSINSQSVVHEYCFVEQINFNSLAFVVDHTTNFSIVSSYVRGHEGVVLMKNSFVFALWLQSKNPHPNAYYALNIDEPGEFQVYDSTKVTAQGVTGAIRLRWPSSSPTTSLTWPTLDASISNGYNSKCFGSNI